MGEENKWQPIVEELKSIVGSDYVIRQKDQIEGYLTDKTAEPVMPKCCTDVVVVKPEDAEAISNIMKYANENSMPVVVRGGGTGLCAGAVPIKPSIILSMERLDLIYTQLLFTSST
jgi:glycolate oxidase